ncbi:aminoacyl--tRNA ligase-related protein [Paenibacillus glacialis]|uniref:Aminoacyl-transfer RNA synthetases class-II family profile domain-containing protein n=1 Tax=Paenibacillus glacialis TaxID=494026 RepID=A0A168D0K7_9BACL|nr:aminoacyl--tRNA ligase-related protein [Paenibacillus glacialis]OAB33774.1 hypothetical protein PGLA_22840 [Paenibacillus glacialis]
MMKTFLIPAKYNEIQIGELLDRLPYISENITGVEYNSTNKTINIYLQDETYLSFLEDGLKDIEDNIEILRVAKQRIIKDNTVSDNLQAKTEVKETKSFYTEIEMILMERLDNILLKIAKGNEAINRQYPSLLTEEAMDRCQYHKSFPQNVYSLFHIPHDFRIIEQIRKESEGLPFPAFVPAGIYLRPCICYHVYEELAQQPVNEFIIYTSRGQCFRHEVAWKTNDFRKTEFTMREIVFVGHREQVESFRNQLMDEIWNLFEKLGLHGKLLTARDPFFHYDDLKTKGAFQAMANAKYELEFISNAGNTFSIASFNNCGDMICQKYGITDTSQEYLYSGCIAFGLDRWKEAICDVYGDNEADWPSLLKNLN